jgi:hypothetical protein
MIQHDEQANSRQRRFPTNAQLCQLPVSRALSVSALLGTKP